MRGGAGGLFDAIITDPPYGIRERAAEVADERYLDRTLPEVLQRSHVPQSASAATYSVTLEVSQQKDWLKFKAPLKMKFIFVTLEVSQRDRSWSNDEAS